jgi:hypothetical protein
MWLVCESLGALDCCFTCEHAFHDLLIFMSYLDRGPLVRPAVGPRMANFCQLKNGWSGFWSESFLIRGLSCSTKWYMTMWLIYAWLV